MEVPGGNLHKGKVFVYEFLGTSLLVYAVLASGGAQVAVVFTVMAIIIMADPISGAHFNPAVSTGVFFAGKGKMRMNLGMYLMILLA